MHYITIRVYSVLCRLVSGLGFCRNIVREQYQNRYSLILALYLEHTSVLSVYNDKYISDNAVEVTASPGFFF